MSENDEEKLQQMTNLLQLGDAVDTSVTELKNKLSDMNEEMSRLIKSVDVLLNEISDIRDWIGQ